MKKKIIKNTLIFLITISFAIIYGNAQISFKIESDIFFPDLSVKISESTVISDISIKIGEKVNFADFTVGITSRRNQADFIITKTSIPEFTIRASSNVLMPDISIKIGENVLFPDVTIKIKTSGVVDYIVYTEKESITMNDLVIALLPAINKEMNYQFEGIPLYTKGSSQNINNSNFSEIIFLLKGAHVFAQDKEQTYLGKIDNKYTSDSIFNEYGTFGSKYSSKSIWNEYSDFGSKYSSYSAFNDYTSSPPIIVKNGKILGYLTTNKYISGGISPLILKSIKSYF